jgi:hypothetical protein
LIELEVDVSRIEPARFTQMVRHIDQLCLDSGLSITMKDTLSKYPGCVHWHTKKGRERGTLEITWWPARERLWFSMQEGRKADWVMKSARQFKRQMERR